MITRYGKVVAKIVTVAPDKKAAWDTITNVFRGEGIELTDQEIAEDKERRIAGR